MRSDSSSAAPGALSRSLRSAGFAVAMTVLATSAHLAGGGQLPGAGATVGAGLLVGFAAYLFARRERGGASVLAATVAAQAMAHVCLMLPTVAGQSASMTMPAGHQMLPASNGAGVSIVAIARLAEAMSAPMLVAHALAAGLLALALRSGERGLHDVTALLRWVLEVVVRSLLASWKVVMSPRRVSRMLVLPLGWTSALVDGPLWGRAPPRRHASC